MIKHFEMRPTMHAGLEDVPIIDFDALESVAEFRQLVEPATLVFAHDKLTGKSSIMFGLEMIRAMAGGLVPAQSMVVARFAIAMESLELEKLIAGVTVVKGFHEYGGTAIQS